MRRALDKVLKDNITMLASVVAWGVLSSVIPIVWASWPSAARCCTTRVNAGYEVDQVPV